MSQNQSEKVEDEEMEDNGVEEGDEVDFDRAHTLREHYATQLAEAIRGNNHHRVEGILTEYDAYLDREYPQWSEDHYMLANMPALTGGPIYAALTALQLAAIIPDSQQVQRLLIRGGADINDIHDMQVNPTGLDSLVHGATLSFLTNFKG